MPEIRKEILVMTDIEEKIAKAEEEIRQLQNRKRKLLNQIKSPLLDKGALIHPYGCVRSAEGFYQRSADTGELHSPTGISFPTPCVLHAR